MNNNFDSDVALPISLMANFLFIWIFIIGGVIVYDKQRTIDSLSKDIEYYEKSYEYLSKGAISRGYMDICTNKQGQDGVWFKDDCM